MIEKNRLNASSGYYTNTATTTIYPNQNTAYMTSPPYQHTSPTPPSIRHWRFERSAIPSRWLTYPITHYQPHLVLGYAIMRCRWRVWWGGCIKGNGVRTQRTRKRQHARERCSGLATGPVRVSQPGKPLGAKQREALDGVVMLMCAGSGCAELGMRVTEGGS